MRVMEITTTVGCKNMCVYCPQSTNMSAYSSRVNEKVTLDRPHHMPLGTFKACLDKIPPSTFIFFAGSAEPWLNPDCTEMLKYAYARKHPIRVYTTLVGVTADDIDLFSTMELDRVVIHLPSEGKRERYSADEQYMALVDKLDRTPIRNLEYMAVGPVQQTVYKIITTPIRQTTFEGMSDFAGTLKGGLAPTRHLEGPIYCVDGRQFWNVLYPNGDVTLCCEDFGMKHVLGNLLEMEYDELFKGAEFKRVMRGLKDDRIDTICRACEYAKPVVRRTAAQRVRARLSGLKRRIMEAV